MRNSALQRGRAIDTELVETTRQHQRWNVDSAQIGNAVPILEIARYSELVGAVHDRMSTRRRDIARRHARKCWRVIHVGQVRIVKLPTRDRKSVV